MSGCPVLIFLAEVVCLAGVGASASIPKNASCIWLILSPSLTSCLCSSMADEVRTSLEVEGGQILKDGTLVFEGMPCCVVNNIVRRLHLFACSAGKRFIVTSQEVSRQLFEECIALLRFSCVMLLHVLKKCMNILIVTVAKSTVLSQPLTYVQVVQQEGRHVVGQLLDELRCLCMKTRIDLRQGDQGFSINGPRRIEEPMVWIGYVFNHGDLPPSDATVSSGLRSSSWIADTVELLLLKQQYISI